MKKIYLLPLTLLLLLQGCTVNFFSLNRDWMIQSTKYAATESISVDFKVTAGFGHYNASFVGSVTALNASSVSTVYNIDKTVTGVLVGDTYVYIPSDILISSDGLVLLREGYYYAEIKGGIMKFYESPDQGTTKGELAMEFEIKPSTTGTTNG